VIDVRRFEPEKRSDRFAIDWGLSLTIDRWSFRLSSYDDYPRGWVDGIAAERETDRPLLVDDRLWRTSADSKEPRRTI
jgi:hypothetical protein